MLCDKRFAFFGLGDDGQSNCVRCGKSICKACRSNKRAISKENRQAKEDICDQCDSEMDNAVLQYDVRKVLTLKKQQEEVYPKILACKKELVKLRQGQIDDIEQGCLIPIE